LILENENISMGIFESINNNLGLIISLLIIIVALIFVFVFVVDTSVVNNSYEMEYATEGVVVEQTEGVEYDNLDLEIRFHDGYIQTDVISISGAGNNTFIDFENNRTKYDVESVELKASLDDERRVLSSLNEKSINIDFIDRDKNVNHGEDITLSGSDFIEDDSHVKNYTWVFSDETLEGESVVKSFQNDEIIELNIFDKQNREHTHTFDLSVSTISDSSSVFSLLVSENEEFSLSSSFSEGDIESISWDFDDGTVGSGSSVSHSYDESGLYTIRMSVSYSDGSELQDTTVVEVLDESDADLYVEESEGFDFEFASGIGDAVEYEWIFGVDNSVVTEEPSVSHTFDSPVVQTVRLEAKDENGIVYSSDIEIKPTVRVEVSNNLPFEVISVSGDYEERLMPRDDLGDEWPELHFSDGVRYKFVDLPQEIEFVNTEENVVLSQKTDADYNSDPSVNWVDEGDTIEFTVTEELGDEMYGYIMDSE